MKQLFLNRENWLLIIPLSIGLLEQTVTGLFTFDIHLHDTYFIINNASTGFIFLIASIVPMFCHVFLRRQAKGSKRVLFWHILISCTCYVILFATMHWYQFLTTEGLAGMPRRYYDYESIFTKQHLVNYAVITVFFTTLAFVILQFLFLVYSVFKLIRKVNRVL